MKSFANSRLARLFLAGVAACALNIESAAAGSLTSLPAVASVAAGSKLIVQNSPAQTAAGKFDGHVLYNALFALLRDQDIALRDPGVRAKWVAEWQHKHDTDGLLSTEDGADRACLEMMLSTNLPHDYYFTPSMTKQNSAEVQSNFAGIGMEIAVQGAQQILKAIPKTATPEEIESAVTTANTITAQHPMFVPTTPEADTPAGKGGIHKGDLVMAVDGVPTVGHTLASVLGKIRGAIGSTVKITVQRKDASGSSSTIDVALVRARIVEHPVHTKDEGNGIFYAKLDNFESQYALQEFISAEFQAAQGNAFIIDLRGNPGGVMVWAKIMLISMIQHGELIDTRSRVGDKLLTEQTVLLDDVLLDVMPDAKNPAVPEITFSGRPPLIIPPDMPIVVLVDGDSYSASEIVAGTLQADHRAVLVGAITGGKGVAQNAFDLPFGRSTHITTMEFLPGGVANDQVGIVPDHEVTEGADDVIDGGDPTHDTQLRAAIAVARDLVDRADAVTREKAAHAKFYQDNARADHDTMESYLAHGKMP
jgi:C-terminal peptidase prc